MYNAPKSAHTHLCLHFHAVVQLKLHNGPAIHLLNGSGSLLGEKQAPLHDEHLCKESRQQLRAATDQVAQACGVLVEGTVHADMGIPAVAILSILLLLIRP